MVKVNLQSLTELIHLILGVAFLRHQQEGFIEVRKDLLYRAIEALSKSHPNFFRDVYFTERGGRPHSTAIEDVLFRLGGVLTERYAASGRYYLKFVGGQYLDQVQELIDSCLDPGQRWFVENLADEFFKEIKRLQA